MSSNFFSAIKESIDQWEGKQLGSLSRDGSWGIPLSGEENRILAVVSSIGDYVLEYGTGLRTRALASSKQKVMTTSRAFETLLGSIPLTGPLAEHGQRIQRRYVMRARGLRGKDSKSQGDNTLRDTGLSQVGSLASQLRSRSGAFVPPTGVEDSRILHTFPSAGPRSGSTDEGLLPEEARLISQMSFVDSVFGFQSGNDMVLDDKSFLDTWTLTPEMIQLRRTIINGIVAMGEVHADEKSRLEEEGTARLMQHDTQGNLNRGGYLWSTAYLSWVFGGDSALESSGADIIRLRFKCLVGQLGRAEFSETMDLLAWCWPLYQGVRLT